MSATAMETQCQACRAAPVAECVADDDPIEPYELCAECARRVRARELRPLEWFNLAAIHGWDKFLLHDDFYNEDGIADQPVSRQPVPKSPVAPTLEEAALSLERLVDYCMTRWHMEEPEVERLRRFPPNDVLAEIDRRAGRANNLLIVRKAYEICARVLADNAESWVREGYDEACRRQMFYSWAEAAASCLPHDEGLRKTMAALDALPPRIRQDAAGSLAYFRSETALDWIERSAPPSNVVENWGRLAACSSLKWDRIERWLDAGRPLSLIALDAMAGCIRFRGESPLQKRLNPRMTGCPDHAAMVAAIRRYMESDPAPRVERIGGYVIQKIDEVCG